MPLETHKIYLNPLQVRNLTATGCAEVRAADFKDWYYLRFEAKNRDRVIKAMNKKK